MGVKCLCCNVLRGFCLSVSLRLQEHVFSFRSFHQNWSKGTVPVPFFDNNHIEIVIPDYFS